MDDRGRDLVFFPHGFQERVLCTFFIGDSACFLAIARRAQRRSIATFFRSWQKELLQRSRFVENDSVPALFGKNRGLCVSEIGEGERFSGGTPVGGVTPKVPCALRFLMGFV